MIFSVIVDFCSKLRSMSIVQKQSRIVLLAQLESHDILCFLGVNQLTRTLIHFLHIYLHLPVAPVKRVLINSLLLVKFVSHEPHEYNLMPLMWSKNMRPILLLLLLSMWNLWCLRRSFTEMSFLSIYRNKINFRLGKKCKNQIGITLVHWNSYFCLSISSNLR